MITKSQLTTISHTLKINEMTVLREYFQVWFLGKLYNQKDGSNLFFKGGTAIRLIFGGHRFSEDLDFTTIANEKETTEMFEKVSRDAQKEMPMTVEKRESLAGITYRLKFTPEFVSAPVFIRLDISLREPILQPEKTVLTTPYPILFTQFVYHTSKQEVVAEKIRALLTREKGRDLYDLWFLFQSGATIDSSLVDAKLSYYKQKYLPTEVIKRLDLFSKKEFVTDLQPFVLLNEREQLPDFYDVVVSAIKTSL